MTDQWLFASLDRQAARLERLVINLRRLLTSWPRLTDQERRQLLNDAIQELAHVTTVAHGWRVWARENGLLNDENDDI